MNVSIRLEEEKDFKSVEYMTREAFWDLYKPGCDEHLVVHKIRKVPAFVKELDFILLSAGRRLIFDNFTDGDFEIMLLTCV